MTSKDDSSVAVTNNMKPHRDQVHQEPTRKGLQEHEAEKGVGASRDTFKDSKAPKCNCRYMFLIHLLWAVYATLFVWIAVGEHEPPSIRQPCPSARPLKETLGAPTMPTSLSQDTNSSSPLPSSHATPVASATVMNSQCPALNATLISEATNFCSALSGVIGAVDVTNVCGNRELICMIGVLLISFLRRRQSS